MSILASGFTVNPRSIPDDYSWDHSIIYGYIVYYCSWKDDYKKNGKLWKRGTAIRPLWKFIRDLPYSESKIKRLTKELVEFGLIIKQREPNGKATRFIVIDYEELTFQMDRKRQTTDPATDPTNVPREDDINTDESTDYNENGNGADPTNDKQLTSQMDRKRLPNELHIYKGIKELSNQVTKNDDTQLSGVPEVSFKYISLTATSQQWSKANEAIVLSWIDDGFSERQVVAAITLGAVRAHEAGVTTINSIKYFDKTLRKEIADADEDYIDYLLMDRSEHGPLLDAVTASGLQKEN